jgi:mRNA interferase MazF
MPYNRGDVVLVLFPDSNLVTAKRRPALVIQADKLNTGLAQTIVAMITSNLSRSGHPSRVTVLNSTDEASQMGLLSDSVVMTDNLATILDSEIDRVIGHCVDMQAINIALRHTFGLKNA